MKKILLSITSAILFSVFALPSFAADEAKDEAKAEKPAKKKAAKKAKKADGEKKGDEAAKAE